MIALVVSVGRCLCDSTGGECWEVSLSVIALVVSVGRCLSVIALVVNVERCLCL